MFLLRWKKERLTTLPLLGCLSIRIANSIGMHCWNTKITMFFKICIHKLTAFCSQTRWQQAKDWVYHEVKKTAVITTAALAFSFITMSQLYLEQCRCTTIFYISNIFTRLFLDSMSYFAKKGSYLHRQPPKCF